VQITIAELHIDVVKRVFQKETMFKYFNDIAMSAVTTEFGDRACLILDFFI